MSSTPTALEQFVAEHGITVNVHAGPDARTFSDEDDTWTFTHFTLSLQDKARRLSPEFPWKQGEYFGDKTPTAADVLECLIRDADLYFGTGTLESFAEQAGFDVDSVSGRKAFKETRKIARWLVTFIGRDALDYLIEVA